VPAQLYNSTTGAYGAGIDQSNDRSAGRPWNERPFPERLFVNPA
jgi:hypothetical protein